MSSSARQKLCSHRPKTSTIFYLNHKVVTSAQRQSNINYVVVLTVSVASYVFLFYELARLEATGLTTHAGQNGLGRAQSFDFLIASFLADVEVLQGEVAGLVQIRLLVG